MSEQLTMGQASSILVKQMRERVKDPKSVWGIPWGFPGLDALTGGIHHEEMTVCMARPGVGKTAFMGQVALNIAEWLQTPEGQREHPGEVVKLVLCEMGGLPFHQRIICHMARLGQRKVREGRLTQENQRAYEEAAERLAALPIEYLDHPSSLDDTVQWLKSGKKPAWFAVDYIGIHPLGPNRPVGQWQKVTELSQGFRELSKRLAPSLILAQMNRECAKREDTRPQLSDLRDSGSLEQDAWNVMGLWREDVFAAVSNEDMDRPKNATLFVLKHRNGPLGLVELKWVPLAGAFVDASNLKLE